MILAQAIWSQNPCSSFLYYVVYECFLQEKYFKRILDQDVFPPEWMLSESMPREKDGSMWMAGEAGSPSFRPGWGFYS